MAKFRQVHTSFWQDARVLEEMTPEDKYFFLYLLTNPNTTQIGVYQITKKQMAFDIGYSMESIKNLMERFINFHKLIKYNEETREIAILNWGKYNLNKAGKPVLDCIKKELKAVKDTSLLCEVMESIPNDNVKELFSRYVNDTYNDSSKVLSTSRGQEEEKEEEKEKEKNNISIATVLEQEFARPVSLMEIQKLQAYIDDGMDHDVVVEAIKRARLQNKPKVAYVIGILNNWVSSHVKTMADVTREDAKFNKCKGGKRSGKPEQYSAATDRFAELGRDAGTGQAITKAGNDTG